ncbi:unnamed protein product [Cylindrotheca closterium]|uniref:GST N-terminal domain-containing protein n=1 Tax=Cylindrotheca closterium TaxID=2856 RepID=A0AAD2FST0_9STRA|nr:unnamed protein product [Cylindrotheca closterium]
MDELKAQGKVPFGIFPVMESDGKILSQTQACATFVGKLGDMYPSNDDPFAQADCGEIINGCTDVALTFIATFRVEDKKTARQKLMSPKDGRLYMLWFNGGTIDHVPIDWIGTSFPNLKKIYDNVESNDKIQAFKKEYYPGKN